MFFVVGFVLLLLRENWLYQLDWFMCFYGFDVQEIVNDQYLNLDLDIDLKLSWVLCNFEYFFVDI